MNAHGSDASDGEFERLLAWAYRGEVSGEALFASLADCSVDARRAAALRGLADLERLMAAAIVPLLHKYSVDGGDDERSRRSGREGSELIAKQSWEEFLEQFGPATEAALKRYRRLRAIAPDRDPVFDELVAHEEALQAFSAAEMRGESQTSLDPVHAVSARLLRAE